MSNTTPTGSAGAAGATNYLVFTLPTAPVLTEQQKNEKLALEYAKKIYGIIAEFRKQVEDNKPTADRSNLPWAAGRSVTILQSSDEGMEVTGQKIANLKAVKTQLETRGNAILEQAKTVPQTEQLSQAIKAFTLLKGTCEGYLEAHDKIMKTQTSPGTAHTAYKVDRLAQNVFANMTANAPYQNPQTMEQVYANRAMGTFSASGTPTPANKPFQFTEMNVSNLQFLNLVHQITLNNPNVFKILLAKPVLTATAAAGSVADTGSAAAASESNDSKTHAPAPAKAAASASGTANAEETPIDEDDIYG